MAGTIETNLREMVEINGNTKGLVQKVRKESIVTAGNNGNGSGQADVESSAAGNGASSHNDNGGDSTVGNGNGNRWASRLKQLVGVVEQEI